MSERRTFTVPPIVEDPHEVTRGYTNTRIAVHESTDLVGQAQARAKRKRGEEFQVEVPEIKGETAGGKPVVDGTGAPLVQGQDAGITPEQPVVAPEKSAPSGQEAGKQAILTALEALGYPQAQMLQMLSTGQVGGEGQTVQQFIETLTPGLTDKFLEKIREVSGDDVVGPALLTLPATIIGAVVDPLNAIPGGAPSKGALKATYAGLQRVPGAAPMRLFNLGQDIADHTGNILHPTGSTVAEETLLKHGFEVPKLPSTFYSPTLRAIEAKMPAKAPVEQVRNIVNTLPSEEREWIGLDEFLAGKEHVTKEEVTAFIKENAIEVEEVVKSSEPQPYEWKVSTDRVSYLRNGEGRIELLPNGKYRVDVPGLQAELFDTLEEAKADVEQTNDRVRGGPRNDAGPKFEKYTLPGGQNYREVLLTLPKQSFESVETAPGEFAPKGQPQEPYRSPHFDEPNVLAHVRLTDRVDSNGSKVLFIEELQSDWHQQGRRKGYASEDKGVPPLTIHEQELDWVAKDDKGLEWGTVGKGVVSTKAEAEEYLNRYIHKREADAARERKENTVPDAPFKSSWHELAMKRMIRYAAEHGYDRIAWTTGAQQAERYDLSKQISKIVYDNGILNAFDLNGAKVIAEDVPEGKLADYVGKEAADKLIATKPDADGLRTLEGLDLKVGGAGMAGFYDRMLPQFVNKYAKKWGARVDETNIAGAGKAYGVEKRHSGYVVMDRTDGINDPVDEAPIFKTKGEAQAWIEANSNTGGVKVHSLELTTPMIESVLLDGQSLMGGAFQSARDLVKGMPVMLKEALNTHANANPAIKKLTEDFGGVDFGAMYLIARVTVAALAGAAIGDEENALRNALIGAGLGVLATPALLHKLTNMKLGKGAPSPDVTKRAANTRNTNAQLAVESAWTPDEWSAQYTAALQEYKVSNKGGVTEPKTVRHDSEVKAGGEALVSYAVVTPESIAKMAPETALTDQELWALHKVLSNSLERCIELAWNADPAIPESIVEYKKQLYFHGIQLDPKRLATRSEAGRAMRIFQSEDPDMIGMQAFLDQGSDLFSNKLKVGQDDMRLVELGRAIKTPEHFTKWAKQVVKPGWQEFAVDLYVRGLLSNPVTHVANITSNALNMVLMVPERLTAAAFGPGEVHPMEAVALVHGAAESFGDAIRVAAKAYLDDAPQARVAGETATAKIEGHVKAMPSEVLNTTGVIGRALDFLAVGYSGITSRPLVAADEFFKSMAFGAELRAQAYRDAYREVVETGLTGDKASKRFADLYDYNMEHPNDDIRKGAREFASYTTFQKNLGPVGTWLAEGASKYPIVRVMAPFIKTPINIFKFGAERTPLALVMPSFWSDIKAGGAKGELALARLSMGSATMGLFAYHASMGNITGGGPKDPDQREALKQSGWKPYSIKINGHFYPYNRIEPIGFLMGSAADFVDIVNHKYDDETESVAVALGVAAAKNAGSKTWVKGVAAHLAALANPEKYGEADVRQLLGSVVPAAVAGVARIKDPVYRDVRELLDGVWSRLPGYSKDLPAKYSPLGEKLVNEDASWLNLIEPWAPVREKNDPVWKEIVKQGYFPSRPKRAIDGLELEPKEYAEYMALIGTVKHQGYGDRTIRQELEHLFESNLYKTGQDGPGARKANLIRERIADYHDLARETFKQNHPEFQAEIRENEKQDAAKQRSITVAP